MGVDMPCVIGAGPLGIDRDDDALAAEFCRPFPHQFRPRHGSGVDAAFVRAGQQQAAHIVHRANAAADGQRQKHPGGGPADDIEDGVPVFVAGGDVQKGQFIGAGGIVDHRLFHRVPGIAQIDETHAFDDATILYIETGDHPQFQHGTSPRRAGICGAMTPHARAKRLTVEQRQGGGNIDAAIIQGPADDHSIQGHAARGCVVSQGGDIGEGANAA